MTDKLLRGGKWEGGEVDRTQSPCLCPFVMGHSGSCRSPVLCLMGRGLWVVASCLAPVLYWQMELDLAEAQLYICLGFTLGWKLEAASLSVKRQGNSVLNVWAGRMQGFLGQDLFLHNLPRPCQTPCPDLAEMFHSLGWKKLRHECCCKSGGGRSR